ncbi:MAG: transglutaminase family protein [Pseudomonadota bacterium]
MIYQVSHHTRYGYSEPTAISHHVLHLAPRTFERQQCHHYTLDVEPAPATSVDDTDYFGNPVTHLTVQQHHTELTFHSRSVVEVMPVPPAHDVDVPWEHAVRELAADRSTEGLARAEYGFTSPYTAASPELAEYAAASFAPGRRLLDAARDLTSRIHRDFDYRPGSTSISTPVDQVLAERRGVCQDFSHLQISAMRALGLAVRYVSGYLVTQPPDDADKLRGADASHAWLSVWLPNHGWLDLDPTNNVMPTDQHVTVAWGRDYGDVSPIMGVILGGGEHQIDVAVEVVPFDGVPPAPTES